MMYGFPGFGMGFGPIFALLFWGFIIYLLFLFFKSIASQKDSETPLEILKKRLANGEIDEKTFERLKKKL